MTEQERDWLRKIDSSVERISYRLEGDERTRQPGIIQRMDEHEERLEKIESIQKRILNIIIGIAIGLVIWAAIFGVMGIREAVNLVK